MKDVIIDEIRKRREEYCARYNYDLDAMFADIAAREKDDTVVTLPPKLIAKDNELPRRAATLGER